MALKKEDLEVVRDVVGVVYQVVTGGIPVVIRIFPEAIQYRAERVKFSRMFDHWVGRGGRTLVSEGHVRHVELVGQEGERL